MHSRRATYNSFESSHCPTCITESSLNECLLSRDLLDQRIYKGDHWAKMGVRTTRTRREERERREEGRIEGDEAARTDGCCQGSAKKVHKIKGRTYRIPINPEKNAHWRKVPRTCSFSGKDENLFWIVEPKGISAGHSHLVPGEHTFQNYFSEK